MTTDQGPGEPNGWKSVWAKRQLDPNRGSILAQLLAADGYDNTYGAIDEQAWRTYAKFWAAKFDAGPNTSVFEVGCGAGAFLYVLHEMGCSVAGIDQSEALVTAAKEALPGGDFAVGDAADVALRPQSDLVIAASVLFYFPDLDYARKVIERMATKARTAVLLIDLPDAAHQEDALAFRIASHGGSEAYAARYRGLDHLYFERAWVSDVLRSCGLEDVNVVDQELSAYGNAPYRFNAWGIVPGK